AVFFVAMWFMAKKKIENWIYWIVGDVITVPLYIYKGLAITSVQYLIFTILAVMGYVEWQRRIRQQAALTAS
ncbi:MAG: nicotinamide riboside transporter PnuC, partial [Bacteroidetes bacterium]